MGIINNKKGVTTLALIFVIIFSLILVGLFIIGSYTFGLVDDSLTQIEVSIGNDSFQTVYQDTLQLGIKAMETTVPQIASIAILLGMIIVMLIIGYSTKKMGRLWMLVDIGVLIIAEILAVIVTSNFSEYVSSNPAFITIVRDTIPLAAKFILNLPILVPTIGIIIMITTHLMTKEKEESE